MYCPVFLISGFFLPGKSGLIGRKLLVDLVFAVVDEDSAFHLVDIDFSAITDDAHAKFPAKGTEKGDAELGFDPFFIFDEDPGMIDDFAGREDDFVSESPDFAGLILEDILSAEGHDPFGAKRIAEHPVEEIEVMAIFFDEHSATDLP